MKKLARPIDKPNFLLSAPLWMRYHVRSAVAIGRKVFLGCEIRNSAILVTNIVLQTIPRVITDYITCFILLLNVI